MAGVQRGGKGERRAREGKGKDERGRERGKTSAGGKGERRAREGKGKDKRGKPGRIGRAHFDFPSFLRLATQATVPEFLSGKGRGRNIFIFFSTISLREQLLTVIFYVFLRCSKKLETLPKLGISKRSVLGVWMRKFGLAKRARRAD